MNEIAELIAKKMREDELKAQVIPHQEIQIDWHPLDFLYHRPNSFVTKMTCTHKPLNSSFEDSLFLSQVVNTATIKLPEPLQNKANEISLQLNVTNDVQNDIDQLLLKLYHTNTQREISISRSADKEFLIYLRINDTYKNILIDEDGDIELLVIPSDKSKSYNKIFYKEDGINFSNVVSTFNEMQ